MRALVDAGHELGCHGVTHTAFDRMDERTARWEIEHSARVLRDFASVDSFRAPYLRFPEPFVRLLEQSGFALDSSLAKYKRSYRAPRLPTTLRRIPASMTSSVLRLPAIVRDPWLARLRDPVVLFVHPWEFVDLTRERLRLDCRFRTGDVALALPARGDRVVPRARRALRDDARARRVSVPGGRRATRRRRARASRARRARARARCGVRRRRAPLDPTRAWDAIATVRGAWLAAAALCYLAILPALGVAVAPARAPSTGRRRSPACCAS